jgi:curved DNA-binding protein CbpA
MADLYAALGVAPTADMDAIRTAYRALARRHHPDAGGSTPKMAALNNAYGVLSDKAARRQYDACRFVPVFSYEPPAASANTATGWSSSRDVLDFGRYEGWSIVQISSHDPDYLEWLARAPIGRAYRDRIASALEGQRSPRVAVASRPPRRRGFWRR